MKTKLFLFALLAQFFSMTAFAYDAKIDGIYYNFYGTEATVTYAGENSYSGDIVIPQSVTDNEGNTYDVTSIDVVAFDGCSSLTSITIPNSIESIGNYAFYNCSSLTSITIPNSVTSIESSAFGGCSSLTSITIPNSIESIGNYAFEYCNNVKEVNINIANPNVWSDQFSNLPNVTRHLYQDGEEVTNLVLSEGLTSIPNKVFYNCSSLTSITIPNSVTSIGDDAFSGCSGLTSITIPKNVTTIGTFAFNGCFNLTSITIPKNVTSIGLNFFNGLSAIVVEEGNTKYDSRNGCNAIIETASNTLIFGCENTTIPNSVTSIGENAFMYSSLTSIIIPEGVTSIGENAFFNCNGLTSIAIPESVTSIGSQAFYACGSLTSITIPENVINIGYNALNKTPWYDNLPEGLVYVGKVAYGYKGTMPENTMIEIKEGTLGIAAAAFSGRSSLTSIIIPESVTSIGNSAFDGCSGLTSITIPESVKSIGDWAFYGCSGLTSITIPESMNNISMGIFMNCSSLTSAIIPKSVTSIGGEAFYGCYALTSIRVGMKNPIAFSSSVFYSDNYRKATLYVPHGSKTAYEAADYWNECKEIIECDYVDVENQIIVAGQSETIEINVNNYDKNLVGFQMDLTLPGGVSLDKAGCSLSSRITDEEQELTIGKLESGTYRLTSTSLSLKPISDTDGTLLTLKLIAAKDCVDGKATISNVIFSTSDSQRVTMDDESFDITIYYTYKLSYLVDGEEYMADSVVYNTPLTPVAEPVKAGYTFLEWIGQPEVMPNHDVVVTGRFYLYGDVNTDEAVDVVDVVDIARFVVAMPSTNFREKLADLNYDNTVNIADAVTLVNHIAGDQNFVKAEKPISTDYAQCQLQLQSTGQKALSLSLAGGADFTAFQFEVDVPENTDISAMRINGLRKNGHQLLYNKVSENRYRVAALSLSNATFNGSEGELLNISIDGLPTDDVCIHDIHFVTTAGKDITFDNLSVTGTITGITEIVNSKSSNCKLVYDLQGRHRSTLQRGLNIVGNKTIIKK